MRSLICFPINYHGDELSGINDEFCSLCAKVTRRTSNMYPSTKTSNKVTQILSDKFCVGISLI